MKPRHSSSRVAEIQGPYGPLQVLETKIQQVWALQQFQPGRWVTAGGSVLRIRSPGLWNRGAGPDFRDAVLELDGHIRAGDVEFHLYREDWWRHGHAVDPAYNRVILHVVLFAGGMERRLVTESGMEPEEWVLGPWMREDVESVSGGEPGLFGEQIPEIREWIESDDPEVLVQKLRLGADRRWQDKESMARCLREAAGWEGALHRMVLYYLGFPVNRRPFYEIAEAFPPQEWRNDGLLARIRDQWADRIRWGTGRPANRALPRLEDHLRLHRTKPGWAQGLRAPPAALVNGLQALLDSGGADWPTGLVRRTARFRQWRAWLVEGVCRGALGPGLVDRLWVDVFLPLMGVEGVLAREQALVLWYHACPGQYPAAYNPLLRLIGTRQAGDPTRSNGWVQGLLWMEDQLRLERVRTATGAAAPAGPGSGA